jgi:hypothetical protein
MNDRRENGRPINVIFCAFDAIQAHTAIYFILRSSAQFLRHVQ